jgi:TonB family protein
MRYAISLIVTLALGCGTLDRAPGTLPHADDPASVVVGGYMRVEPPIEPPVPIRRVEPTYPEEYRHGRVTGHVVLEVAVSEHGTVDHVSVRRSVLPALDQAAAYAVGQWAFRPATLHAKPVPVLFNMTVAFKSSDETR